MEFTIHAEGLVKRFGETTAPDGVDLAARPGTVLGVLGPNGAGKTTAVRVLATLLVPDAGHATIGGYDVVRDAHRVRRQIGLTGQYAAVDETLTGQENLVLIGRLLGLSRPQARARASELLAQFSLSDAGGRATKTYSGGMRRRLDLAASLIGRPDILFLDEPTTGLDPRSRNELWDTVRDLTADGTTVLLTTQYLEEADQLAHDLAVIDHGRVIATGTPASLKSRAGRQSLLLEPADAAHLETVRTVVRDLTGAESEVTGTTLTAAVTDSTVVPLVVRRLHDAGVDLVEMSLHRPSLDEVFLALTGHRADQGSADSEPELEGAPA